MITGIGIDLVTINRFAEWPDYSDEKLRKIFNEGELLELKAYADENGERGEVRFIASRYAAKEAFFKALSATLVTLGHVHHAFNFLQSCKHVSIVTGHLGVPSCVVDWHHFETLAHTKLPHLHALLSISHEGDSAVAQVMIQNN